MRWQGEEEGQTFENRDKLMYGWPPGRRDNLTDDAHIFFSSRKAGCATVSLIGRSQFHHHNSSFCSNFLAHCVMLFLFWSFNTLNLDPPKVWGKKKQEDFQKLSINKKSIIFVLSSWNLVKMINSWGDYFHQVSWE